MQQNSFFSFTPQNLYQPANDQIDQIQSSIDFEQKNNEDSEIDTHKITNQSKKFQFNPQIWTNQDQKRLIELHKTIGNKWTSLSKHFDGSCQNSIKNRFYSRLRKSIRKLNKNLTSLFGKRYAKFNLNIIFKLSNVSQGKVIGKSHVESEITQFYKDFIYKLIEFSQTEEDNLQSDRSDLSQEVQNFALGLIALENLFRIISGQRVYKGKKKNIAYLKRFNFKLDTECNKALIISRQNCYIAKGPIDTESIILRSSQSISIVEGNQKSSQIDQEINKVMVDESEPEKTDEKTMCFGLGQKTLSQTEESQATDGSFPSSPYQTLLLDEQLRQYQLYIGNDYKIWSQNLLDQYSGKKFDFNIEY